MTSPLGVETCWKAAEEDNSYKLPLSSTISLLEKCVEDDDPEGKTRPTQVASELFCTMPGRRVFRLHHMTSRRIWVQLEKPNLSLWQYILQSHLCQAAIRAVSPRH